MPKLTSRAKVLDPITEERLTPVVRSVQHFGDVDEIPRRDSDVSSHRSVATEDQISSSSDSDLENKLETDPYFSLSHFESLLFATVIEDTMMALRILGECNNSLRVQRVTDEKPMLLNKKYSIRPPAKQPSELDLIDPKRLDCNQFKMHKLESDRNEIADAMQLTYISLSQMCSFRALWNKCHEITERIEYAESLKDIHMENKTLARTINRQLRQQRVHQRSAAYETNSVVDHMRKQKQDAEQVASIAERYTMKWQNARAEQHQEDIGLKQGVFTDSIEYHKRRSEQESIVHGEIEMLLNVYIQETLQKIEEIMDKYEKDMEKMDLQLQIMMSDVNKITAKNKELEDLFRGRDKEMKAWNKFKQERAKAQKYHDDMTRSANIVQAWWRGLLVRKQLGPFRVKGKPKPAKK